MVLTRILQGINKDYPSMKYEDGKKRCLSHLHPMEFQLSQGGDANLSH